MILLKFWREVLLTILLGAVWQLYGVNTNLKDKLEFVTKVAEECNVDKINLTKKIALIEESTRDLEKNHRDAEKKRLSIISTLTNQVNNIRIQEPPKDCQKAIEWAVQNKGDISWPSK